MAKPSLTLLLPGLATILQQQINGSVLPPSLAKILKRAQFQPNNTQLTRLLFSQFAEIRDQQTDLPMVQLLARTTALNTTTPALCASPCYLQPDRDRLLLLTDETVLSQQESEQLITELQGVLLEFGAQLVRHNSGIHLLTLAKSPKLQLSALADVTNKAVTEYLPKGEDKLAWIRLWNAIQMRLHDSAFQQDRIDAGKMPINGLWFWGLGDFIGKANPWTAVQGELPLLQQLAEATHTPWQTAPWTITYLATGSYLSVLNPLKLNDDWQQQLHQWEQNSIKPAWQACRKAKISQLTLLIPEQGSYILTPLTTWKFY